MAVVTLAPTADDATYQFQVSHEDGWSLQVLVTKTSFSAGVSGASVDDAVTFLGATIAASDDVVSFNGDKFAVDSTSLGL